MPVDRSAIRELVGQHGGITRDELFERLDECDDKRELSTVLHDQVRKGLLIRNPDGGYVLGRELRRPGRRPATESPPREKTNGAPAAPASGVEAPSAAVLAGMRAATRASEQALRAYIEELGDPVLEALLEAHGATTASPHAYMRKGGEPLACDGDGGAAGR